MNKDIRTHASKQPRREYKMQYLATNTSLAATFNEDLFTRFINYTDVKDTTLKNYAAYLRHFFAWIAANHIQQPTRDDIKTYKAALEQEKSTRSGKPLSAGTRAQYLRAVKHFFKWTASEGIYPNIADNIKAAKVDRKIQHKDPLQGEDAKRILESIDTSTEQGARNYAIILLCLTAGLRIIEIQRADLGDIKTIAGEKVLFIQRKGHDAKDVYKKLIPEVQEAITNYLAFRPEAKKSEPLFVGTSNRAKGQRITEPSISRLIKRTFISAGYESERLTAHSLRHTAVTMLLKSGATIQEAADFADHASPNTTMIYAHNLENQAKRYEADIFIELFGNKAKKTNKEQLFDLINGMSEAQISFILPAISNTLTIGA